MENYQKNKESVDSIVEKTNQSTKQEDDVQPSKESKLEPDYEFMVMHHGTGYHARPYSLPNHRTIESRVRAVLYQHYFNDTKL